MATKVIRGWQECGTGLTNQKGLVKIGKIKTKKECDQILLHQWQDKTDLFNSSKAVTEDFNKYRADRGSNHAISSLVQAVTAFIGGNFLVQKNLSFVASTWLPGAWLVLSKSEKVGGFSSVIVLAVCFFLCPQCHFLISGSQKHRFSLFPSH